MEQSNTQLIWPGILLCIAIATISFISWMIYKPISALMWAFVYSIIITNLFKLPQRFNAGINFCSTDLLRGAIASLGIVTSALIWVQVGIGILNSLAIVFFGFFCGILICKKFNLSNTLSTLIGVGTCICGASAIAATGPAIKAKEEEIGMALATITIFGLLAMFIYPILYSATFVGDLLLHNPNVYAIWCGSGIHETAQVIAAAGAISQKTIGAALLVKSIRIFMIGPMIFIAIYVLNKMESKKIDKNALKTYLPVYGIIFIINSIFCAMLDTFSPELLKMGFDWPIIKNVLSTTILPFLLATSFAAVGLKVRFKSFMKIGLKAFLSGALVAFLAGILSLLLAIIVAPLVPI